MPIKTSLPSQKRLFGWFLVLAIVLTTFIYNVAGTPSADEPAANGSSNPCKLDLVVALDISNNMDESYSSTLSRFGYEKYLSKRVIDYYQTQNSYVSDASKAKVALVSIKGSPIAIDKPLNADLDGYKTQINELKQARSAAVNIGETLDKASDELKSNRGRDGAKKVVLVISAGKNSEGPNPVDKSKALRKAGIDVYSIHLGSSNVGVSDDIAGAPKATHYDHNPGNRTLAEMLGSITPRACAADRVINPCKTDIQIVLDVSKSMSKKDEGTENRIQKARQGIRTLINYYDKNNKKAVADVKTHIGLVTFDTSSTVLQTLTDDLDVYRNRLTDVRYTDSGTNIGGAINEAERDLFNSPNQRPDAKKVIILVTDGQDSAHSHPRQQAEAAKDHGVTIFSIRLGDVKGTAKLMRGIASDGKVRHYYSDPKVTQLENIFDAIAPDSCPAKNLTVDLDSNKTVVRGNDEVVLTYKITNNSDTEVRDIKIQQPLPPEFVTDDGKATTFTLNVGDVPVSKKPKVVRQTVKLK